MKSHDSERTAAVELSRDDAEFAWLILRERYAATSNEAIAETAARIRSALDQGNARSSTSNF